MYGLPVLYDIFPAILVSVLYVILVPWMTAHIDQSAHCNNTGLRVSPSQALKHLRNLGSKHVPPADSESGTRLTHGIEVGSKARKTDLSPSHHGGKQLKE